MRNTKLLAASCVLALCAASAQAEGFYAGISAGVASVDVDKQSFDDALTSVGVTGLSSKVDENDTAYKAYLGYRFNEHFAVEGGYVDLGAAQYKASFTGGNAKVDWESHGVFVEAVGILPVGDAFSLFAKGGAYFSDNEADIEATGPGGSASESLNDDGTSFVFGLGGEYAFSKTVSLRAEWERFTDVGDENETGEADVDLVSVGVKVSF